MNKLCRQVKTVGWGGGGGGGGGRCICLQGFPPDKLNYLAYF